MRIICIIIALLLYLSAYSQAEFSELFSIEENFDFVEFDNLFNLYGINHSEIFKYRSDGSFAFRYSDEQLGAIGALDVTYPLRPLVMYPELNYLCLLDNTLSNNRGRINLLSKNVGIALLGCSSVQNHFWFYDGMDFSLTRMNENFGEVAKTGNLSQILRIELNPNFMVEFANRIYLNNPETGILVFDIFGTYIKTIPILKLDRFQVFENGLAYFKENSLIVYNTLDYSEKKYQLPETCLQGLISKNRIIGLQKEKVIIWEVKEP